MSRPSLVQCPCDEVGYHLSPESLHVLLVDDDPHWQQQIQDVLKKCSYEVTICSNGKDALSLLRNKNSQFDIALVDVDMPNMEGLKLLKSIALEMDIPVVFISGNYSEETILEGQAFGASDFYHKPLGIDAAKRLWKSIVHKKFQKSEQQGKNVESRKQSEEACSTDHGDNNIGQIMPTAAIPMLDDDLLGLYNPALDFLNMPSLLGLWMNPVDVMPVLPPGPAPNTKRGQDGEEENENMRRTKKPRVVWTPALHRKFTLAVEHVGLDKATPKIIAEVMNEPNVTRANISSHLQKYREYLQQILESEQSCSGKEEPKPKEPHPKHLKELRKQIVAQYHDAVRCGKLRPATQGPPLLVADPNSLDDDDDPTIQFVEVQQLRDPDTKNEQKLIPETPADPAPDTDQQSSSQQMQEHQGPVTEMARPQPEDPVPGIRIPPHWGKVKVPKGMSITGSNLFLEKIDFPWETDLGFATKRIIEKARSFPTFPVPPRVRGQKRKSSALGDDKGAPGSKEPPPSK